MRAVSIAFVCSGRVDDVRVEERARGRKRFASPLPPGFCRAFADTGLSNHRFRTRPTDRPSGGRSNGPPMNLPLLHQPHLRAGYRQLARIAAQPHRASRQCLRAADASLRAR